MITTTAVFDHSGRTKVGKPGPIEIRITIDRKPFYLNTGVRVLKREWMYDAVVDRTDSDELNKRIRLVRSKAEEYINICLEKNRTISMEALKRAVWSVGIIDKSQGSPLLDWMDGQANVMNLAEGTRKHYSTLLNRLREYDKIHRFEDVTVESICNFDAWLRKRSKITDSGVHNYHKCFKALLSRAVLFDRLEENPYNRLRGHFKRGDKANVEYLTEEEMQAFMAQQPLAGTPLETARDLFVFQMFTGLSYSDALAFDARNYRKIDGAYVFNGERLKTGVPYVSQLLPPVVDVLEKYGWQVPKMDNADYNHALKLLGAAAGITTRLHSHLARHTFATYMLRNGVRIENVSRMLGHTNITQTQRYAKVMAKSVHEDFERITHLIQQQNEKDNAFVGGAAGGSLPKSND